VNASALIERHPEAWREATQHPFLDGIRTGTLPERAFQVWLEQDHIFVSDLLSFQARLLAVAPRPAQAVLASGLVALEAELSWFESVAEAAGINLHAPARPVTAEYRAHLQALLRARYAAAITALWALERVYLEAWSSAAPGAHPYREFVEHWTQSGFAGYVAGLEAAVTDPVETAFLETARLERDFWQMAWDSARG
jgi:thiaminase